LSGDEHGDGDPGPALSDPYAPNADLPFLLLVMESAEAEPFQSTETRLA
jgi:hypothetical protein